METHSLVFFLFNIDCIFCILTLGLCYLFLKELQFSESFSLKSETKKLEKLTTAVQ